MTIKVKFIKRAKDPRSHYYTFKYRGEVFRFHVEGIKYTPMKELQYALIANVNKFTSPLKFIDPNSGEIYLILDNATQEKTVVALCLCIMENSPRQNFDFEYD